MKKMKADGCLYDVTTFEDYIEHEELYRNRSVAIECDEYALPIRPRNSTLPGAIVFSGSNLCYYVNLPETEEEKKEYSINNVHDYSKASSTAELLKTHEKVTNLESEILTSEDNKFHPTITENDSPAMAGFKEAINLKNIDIDRYASRMGKNFSNNRRMFYNSPADQKKSKKSQENSISLKKISEIANAFDMKVTLTFEDARENVCNPMGRPVSVVITDTTE